MIETGAAVLNDEAEWALPPDDGVRDARLLVRIYASKHTHRLVPARVALPILAALEPPARRRRDPSEDRAAGRMMKDLLLFARPPQPRLAVVDAHALVAATADLLSGDPAFKNVRVFVNGSAPPIQADPELLKIVFMNLLVNSSHAMAGDGTIRVSLSAMSETCRIAFHDTGPGISSDVRAKLFTPFVTTKARGTGLGLSTAKRLIEAQRGTITVSCPPDGGTIVTVQLPAQIVAQA